MSAIRNVFITYVGNEARRHTQGHGLRNFALGMIAARIATRSVPGAMLVAGVLIAKRLYDDAKADQARAAADMIIEIEGRPVPAGKPIVSQSEV
ncbi:hypothetical protein [Parasphingorhabdus sp.]|uniref:hypothetical protein n=1 Tax=Parasphingorhabdus sp. TaxID=2709688 RepID=UPI003A95B176